jgi:Delta3-Delta2-enoyl-CoA isomerase
MQMEYFERVTLLVAADYDIPQGVEQRERWRGIWISFTLVVHENRIAANTPVSSRIVRSSLSDGGTDKPPSQYFIEKRDIIRFTHGCRSAPRTPCIFSCIAVYSLWMILTFEHGAVRELRLNRPPVNALSPELIAAILRAVQTAPREAKRALVLSGSPGMFSAGLDVPALLKLDRPAMECVWHDFYALMNALASSPIPIAVAITGHAPAGGTVLALFCDWRVGAEGDFKIGLSEVQVGLPLPPVILSALRRLVGARQAERLAVTGLLVSPGNAAMLGLVDEVVPAAQVVDRALEWCQDLLALPKAAMDLTRGQARADLVGEFARDIEHEVAEVSSWWWNQETQAALHRMVEQLAMKKK